jgi:hypothetical protein
LVVEKLKANLSAGDGLGFLTGVYTRKSRTISGFTTIPLSAMRCVSGLIATDEVREMLAHDNSGFSLDAAVRVAAHGRAGVERLLGATVPARRSRSGALRGLTMSTSTIGCPSPSAMAPRG